MPPITKTTYAGLAFAGLVLIASAASAASLDPGQLPAPVSKTFHAQFPHGRIDRAGAEKENGVMVYDLEFTDGKQKKETDIAADGTMLEWTLVVAPSAVPAPAMKAIRDAAAGATVGHLEQVRIGYETRDGKVIKLARSAVHYEATLSRGHERAEVTVTQAGQVVESPEWKGAGKAN